MQKAQPLKFDETVDIMKQNTEAWKKAAERKIHPTYSLPIHDPAIPDEMKAVVDLVGRLTWQDACEHVSDGEKIAACHANSEAVDEYARELDKKAAGQPEQASAAPKRVASLPRLGDSGSSSYSPRSGGASGAPFAEMAPRTAARAGFVENGPPSLAPEGSRRRIALPARKV